MYFAFRYLGKIAARILFPFLAVTMLTACSAKSSDTVVYLVRHAEKITGENAGRDPALTEAGAARSQELASLLSETNISYIHSSDYIRTRDTGAPLAKAKELKIEIYDPTDLQVLADKIKKLRGSHLVVGHSNTIPETVVALGGDGGTPIYEASEYDRLYKLTILDSGIVHTDLKSYGTPYTPDE